METLRRVGDLDIYSFRGVEHSVNRAVFLDRDGVINRKAPEGEYILLEKDFEILPDAPAAIRSLSEAGFLVIVVTNQRCVARGLLSEAGLQALHKTMLKRLQTSGAVVNAVYYCPHEADNRCACRKPKPGMFLKAASDHAIELTASWMIGDHWSDVEAGNAAGCRSILLADAAHPVPPTHDHCKVAASLSKAVEYILQHLESAR